MSNLLIFKSSNSIGWTLLVESKHVMSRVSESFLLKGVKCNLRYEQSHGVEKIFFESDFKFIVAVDIIVIAPSKDNNSFANDCFFKRFKFHGKIQEIWKKDWCYPPRYLSLDIISHEIPILKELQPEDIPENHVPSESLKPSFSENMVHLQAFSRDFKKLLDGNSSFDVEIICDESKIKAHKIVLETRSPVLSAMLKSDMAEGKSDIIHVDDIRSPIFENFLRYLYTGMLPELCIETAKELYIVGDMYAVEEIKKACSEFLYINLSENNACETLVFADLHSDEEFREKVISYIVEKKIPQHDKLWEDFCNLHSNLATEVLNTFIKRHC